MSTKEALVEVRNGIEYELEPVKYESKCVGLAPTMTFKTDEAMLEHYGLATMCSLASRQLKQDVKNTVRAKYNRDKVTASTVIKAIGDGVLTPEMQQEALAAVKAGKHRNFTEACAVYLGVGEDALKNADPGHIHWDCAR